MAIEIGEMDGKIGGLCAQSAELVRQTARRRVKWFLRDEMRPSFESLLISAESALRSTQRKFASCCLSKEIATWVLPWMSACSDR